MSFGITEQPSRIFPCKGKRTQRLGSAATGSAPSISGTPGRSTPQFACGRAWFALLYAASCVLVAPPSGAGYRECTFLGVELGHAVADHTFVGLLLASRAESEDLQAVVDQLETMVAADSRLDCFQIRRKNSTTSFAVQADQMIVVLVAVGGFVVGVAGAQAVFADQSSLHQQVEGCDRPWARLMSPPALRS